MRVSLKYVYGIDLAKFTQFKMVAVLQWSKNFEIQEKLVEARSLFFDLSPHLHLYMLPGLRNASEFELCLVY